MLTKEYVVGFKEFPIFPKTKKQRRPYLCQVFTYARLMSILVEPDQIILQSTNYNEEGQLLSLEM